MAMTLLRWSLALVLGCGALLLLVSLAHGGHAGLPIAVAIALGAAELIAAVLFLVPRTVRLGGAALIGVLAVAAALHAMAGEVPPVSFVVYALAIWAVMRGPVRS
jgi:hypothetical protein